MTELLTSRMSAIDAGVYIGRVEALGVRCSSVQRHEMTEIVLDIDDFDLDPLYDQRQTKTANTRLTKHRDKPKTIYSNRA